MKFYFLIPLLIFTLISTSCGGTPEIQAIPSGAVDAIYGITEDEIINQYIAINTVEDKDDYYYIALNLKPVPLEIVTLEEAYQSASIYTRAVAQSAAIILNGYNINKDISVWAMLPLGNGEVALLGNTWYDASLQITKEFKRYKP